MHDRVAELHMLRSAQLCAALTRGLLATSCSHAFAFLPRGGHSSPPTALPHHAASCNSGGIQS